MKDFATAIDNLVNAKNEKQTVASYEQMARDLHKAKVAFQSELLEKLTSDKPVSKRELISLIAKL